jgi:hypothetical protein
MRCSLKRILLPPLLAIAIPYLVAQPTRTAVVPTYPATSVGLEHLMSDMLLLQKSGDSTALAPYLQSLILPDSDRWFSSKFGETRCGDARLGPNDCLGPRMAFTYRSLASVLPASFSLTLTDILHEGLTNFEATNYTEECPGPQRIIAARELVAGLFTTPHLSSMLSGLVQHGEPLYVLWAYSEHKETTLPFFVYVDGGFRYIGMLHPASVENFQKGAPEAAVAPGPSAHNLTEDQLEMKEVVVDPSLAQRTVVLRVSVGPNGKAKDVKYLRGSEREKESAIQTSMKRHFDRPGFGPGGVHGNLVCVSIAPSH